MISSIPPTPDADLAELERLGQENAELRRQLAAVARAIEVHDYLVEPYLRPPHRLLRDNLIADHLRRRRFDRIMAMTVTSRPWTQEEEAAAELLEKDTDQPFLSRFSVPGLLAVELMEKDLTAMIADGHFKKHADLPEIPRSEMYAITHAQKPWTQDKELS